MEVILYSKECNAIKCPLRETILYTLLSDNNKNITDMSLTVTCVSTFSQ